MKFGVLQFFSWPERRVPLETVYERAFDRIRKPVAIAIVSCTAASACGAGVRG